MAVEAAAAPMANLVNNLQPTFRRWIERLEVGTDDRPLNGLIHPQGKVLDFNYTEFIETLYGVKEVCYIHGSRKKKKKLILGHKPGAAGNFHQKNRKPQNYRQAMIDVAQDNVFDLIGQYDKDLTKDSQEIIKNNQAFFDGLACTEQIVVIGHSISLVDWDYFIEVNKKASNAHWCFGIYGLNDLRNMAELVKSLNIKNYDIFRTDSIWTKPKKVGNGKASQRALKPRIFQEDEITVTIRQMYDLMIADSYEIILPNHAKSIVIYEHCIFVVMDDLDPRCWKIFKRVPRLGVVLQDSILATEDCGRPHMAASSRWLRPSAFRCSTMAVTIAATSSVSLMSFAVLGSTVRTYSL